MEGRACPGSQDRGKRALLLRAEWEPRSCGVWGSSASRVYSALWTTQTHAGFSASVLLTLGPEGFLVWGRPCALSDVGSTPGFWTHQMPGARPTLVKNRLQTLPDVSKVGGKIAPS